MNRIIAIDFDGTINKYTDWKGIGQFEDPVVGVSSALSYLKKIGCKIIIHTCRVEIQEVSEYLQKNNIPFDEINKNTSDAPVGIGEKKVFAHVYVDDRGITFEGLWDSEFIEKIINHEPWFLREEKQKE